ncbi:MAG: hypothetical protein LBV51_05070 [Acholeplasmatales bacterium]|jgi:hypothetical protein|nr:hypothetical protein [Acholeplasmatales bacterium]
MKTLNKKSTLFFVISVVITYIVIFINVFNKYFDATSQSEYNLIAIYYVIFSFIITFYLFVSLCAITTFSYVKYILYKSKENVTKRIVLIVLVSLISAFVVGLFAYALYNYSLYGMLVPVSILIALIAFIVIFCISPVFIFKKPVLKDETSNDSLQEVNVVVNKKHLNGTNPKSVLFFVSTAFIFTFIMVRGLINYIFNISPDPHNSSSVLSMNYALYSIVISSYMIIALTVLTTFSFVRYFWNKYRDDRKKKTLSLVLIIFSIIILYMLIFSFLIKESLIIFFYIVPAFLVAAYITVFFVSPFYFFKKPYTVEALKLSLNS